MEFANKLFQQWTYPLITYVLDIQCEKARRSIVQDSGPTSVAQLLSPEESKLPPTDQVDGSVIVGWYEHQAAVIAGLTLPDLKELFPSIHSDLSDACRDAVLRKTATRLIEQNQATGLEVLLGKLPKDEPAYEGGTLLCLAVAKGSYETCHLLVTNGVDLDKPNGAGKSPLYLAAEKVWWQLISLLLIYGAALDPGQINQVLATSADCIPHEAGRDLHAELQWCRDMVNFRYGLNHLVLRHPPVQGNSSTCFDLLNAEDDAVLDDFLSGHPEYLVVIVVPSNGGAPVFNCTNKDQFRTAAIKQGQFVDKHGVSRHRGVQIGTSIGNYWIDTWDRLNVVRSDCRYVVLDTTSPVAINMAEVYCTSLTTFRDVRKYAMQFLTDLFTPGYCAKSRRGRRKPNVPTPPAPFTER